MVVGMAAQGTRDLWVPNIVGSNLGSASILLPVKVRWPST